MDAKETLIFCAQVTFLVFMFTLGALKEFFTPLWRFLFAPKLPLTVRTPERRFKGLEKLGYDFKPHYVELPYGAGITFPRLHYIDEGNRNSNEVILCLHGEPSWSFLYRNMIPTFVKAGYRVIAPDFIGFGKSDKYTSMDNYNHEMHMATLRLLIEHLDLQNMTMVCQDWGGGTGLCVLKDIPERFSSVVIMNTGLPTGDVSGDDPQMTAFEAFKQGLPFLLWRSLAWLLGTHIPVGLAIQFVTHLPKHVCMGYEAPFPDNTYKAGVAKWPLMMPLFRDDPVGLRTNQARHFLKTWTKPALIMFSDADPITKGQEQIFKRLLPHAKEVEISGGAHFLQDTHGEDLARNIVEFKEKSW